MTSRSLGSGGRLRRPLRARDRDQPHRASTPLELLFDLCFVVAVAQAAARLGHALAGGRRPAPSSATCWCSSPSGGRG